MRTVQIEDNTGLSLIDITKVSFCHRVDNQVEIIIDGIRVIYQYDNEDDAASTLQNIIIAMMWVPDYTYQPNTVTWPSTDPIIYTSTGGTEGAEINWEYVNANYTPGAHPAVNLSLDKNFGR